MLRSEFLTSLAMLGAARYVQSADDKGDPAQQASSQALRVLLGTGSAQPLDAQSFLYDGRKYRGTFRVDGGSVITTVGLEQYLYSVVPREMPPSWPAAALQAQAIVARTFVLTRSAPGRAYDLIPSEVDQVYTGMDAEHPQSSQAVDATAGQVLRYQGGFALGLYSSCCGGHTEASSDAWGGPPVPYLAGVPCTYCAPAPWYSWTEHVPLDRLQSALAALLPPDAQIDNVELDTPDSSGRARFWIVDAQGDRTRIAASKIRANIGTRVLPSLRIKKLDLTQSGARTLNIDGAGLGHGVGLCQWGARGMAQQGSQAGDILAFYYPGTSLGTD